MMKRLLTVALCLLCLFAAAPAKSASGAEMLVYATDSFGATPEEERFAWKQGHVIAVQADGFTWSTAEGLPTFWLVKVPGMTVDEAVAYTEQRFSQADPDNPAPTGPRMWWFDANQLSASNRNALITTGVITLTRNQALDCLLLVQTLE